MQWAFSLASTMPRRLSAARTYEALKVFQAPVTKRLEALREVLTTGERSLAQGALAYIWARSETTLPIPGIRNEAQAVENAAAMEFGPLTQDQVAEVDRIMGRV